MAVTVRPAEPADAPAGARCHIACWREAYAGLVDPELLAQRTRDLAERTERWRQALHYGPRWIAVEDSGEVVGFSAAGTGRDEDIDVPTELYALYVRGPYYGTGLADRLLAAAVGAAPAYLWVFEANPRAQAFYRRHGFRPDGARKHDPFFDRPEIRMRRPPINAADPGRAALL